MSAPAVENADKPTAEPICGAKPELIVPIVYGKPLDEEAAKRLFTYLTGEPVKNFARRMEQRPGERPGLMREIQKQDRAIRGCCCAWLAVVKHTLGLGDDVIRFVSMTGEPVNAAMIDWGSIAYRVAPHFPSGYAGVPPRLVELG